MARHNYKRPNNKKFTVHHLVQKCDNWANHPDNLRTIRRDRHIAFHLIFWERYTLPIDKIRRIIDFHKPILADDFIQAINNILDMYEEKWAWAYKSHAFTKIPLKLKRKWEQN